MAFYVYMLANKRNGTLYVGMTDDLVRRVWEHREGALDGFTRRYGDKDTRLVRRARLPRICLCPRAASEKMKSTLETASHREQESRVERPLGRNRYLNTAAQRWIPAFAGMSGFGAV